MNLEKTLKVIIGFAAFMSIVLDWMYKVSLGENPFVLFMYFTIQSNIIVTIYSFFSLGEKQNFFSGPGFSGLAMLNISITGIIFFLLLRETYQPEGIGAVANILAHYAVPIMMVVDFILSKRRPVFRYFHILPWLGYAAGYLVPAITKGMLGYGYPYPFLDAGKLGAGQVAINVFFISLAFAMIATVLIAIDRRLKKV